MLTGRQFKVICSKLTSQNQNKLPLCQLVSAFSVYNRLTLPESESKAFQLVSVDWPNHFAAQRKSIFAKLHCKNASTGNEIQFANSVNIKFNVSISSGNRTKCVGAHFAVSYGADWNVCILICSIVIDLKIKFVQNALSDGNVWQPLRFGVFFPWALDELHQSDNRVI